jgi:glycosyltransferase involved in cell wall biosynthesis
MNLLSACLITFNEEENLPRVLDSVEGIADEIVIVDCGSKDRTQEIARERGVRLVTQAWTNFAEQKNAAAAAASHEWILSLDADEELSNTLRDSLSEWKKQAPAFSVYEVARRTWYLGKWIHYSGWYPDFQRRLYRRDAARFSGIIHESLRFGGKPGRLHGDLLHYTVRSFEEHKQKVERYTILAAQQMYAAGERNWRAARWLATPGSFLQNLLLRGGFLDGYHGALISWMAARSVWQKYGKLGQLVEEERRARGTKTS